MATGRAPFSGATPAVVVDGILNRQPAPPSHLNPAAPEALDQVILGAMEKDRTLRVQSAAELRANLLRLRRDTSSGTMPAARALPTHAGRLRPRMIAAAALLVVAALAAVHLWTRRDTGQTDSPRGLSPAEDAYMRGRYFTQRGLGHDERAVAAYEQAVKLDPQFAAGWAALARSYTARYFELGEAEAEQKAFVAVERALRLDPTLAEAHLARGDLVWTRANGFPHGAALRDFKRAIELDPKLADAHAAAARVLWHAGLLDQAKREIDTARELQPNDRGFAVRRAWITLYDGRCSEAAAELLTLQNDLSAAVVALECAGRTGEARALADQLLGENPKAPIPLAVKALMAAKSGETAAAEVFISRAVDAGSNANHFHHVARLLASAYALMGNTDASLQWLERAAFEGLPVLPTFMNDPNLRSVRSDPRFKALADRIAADQREFAPIMR